MPLYVKDTDIEIIGTLEVIQGVALATGIDAHGDPIYTGDTKIWWDEQKTVRRAGHRVWVDEEGNERLETEIEEREKAEDERGG